mmetsp:Transcript_26497/g.58087  ORF Transcript_26497/g.58087 Transcript_26497/m.58087 type:complete len:423 (-) Transcript_26497:16-1284(-)|eukprot:CAMPEP_0178566670 /NCGR_PEP_ID=MMETSP0697-20121206/14884_1 /TAXON_ID=265572 /ORGANISM="Extubocellulus spinifer, Strain CCMP396" /LENGTH=422 /DNA_ID=CAMNT_0020200489 /DNA_START=65 /DNA_END=1333 /DNA_ORIENTATION=+
MSSENPKTEAAAAAAASPAPAPAAAAARSASSNKSGEDEEQLRRKLRAHLHQLTKREPLDPTYSFLLSSGSARAPFIPKDRLYKRLGAELRATTERLMLSPGGNDPHLPGKKLGEDREALDEAAMRSAFTLRAGKKHEQQALAQAALMAPPRGVRLPRGWDVKTHRNRLEGMALGLQDRERKKKLKAERARLAQIARTKLSAAEREAAAERGRTATDTAAEAAESEAAMQARALAEADEVMALNKQKEKEKENEERLRRIERERQRTEQMRRREEEANFEAERQRAELQERQRMAETPRETLYRFYHPIFQALWDMEWETLDNMNPFRLVIDENTCAAMGVPDYCDVIKKPMNLTFIKEKAENRSYSTLQEFLSDVELMINNALTFNSDPKNVYHVAALDLQKKFKKKTKKVLQILKVQQKK